MRRQEEIEKLQKKIKNLFIYVLLFIVSIIMYKINLIKIGLAVSITSFIYVCVNYNIINIFFNSKRSKIKLYFSVIIELIYFFLNAFTLTMIGYYIILVCALIYMLREDEGRENINKILQFIGIYTLIKIIYIINLIIFFN